MRIKKQTILQLGAHSTMVLVAMGAWLLGMHGIAFAFLVAITGAIVFTLADSSGPKANPKDGRWIRWTFTSNLMFSAMMAVIYAVVLA